MNCADGDGSKTGIGDGDDDVIMGLDDEDGIETVRTEGKGRGDMDGNGPSCSNFVFKTSAAKREGSLWYDPSRLAGSSVDIALDAYR